MQIRSKSALMLALALAATIQGSALEAQTPRSVAEIRLLPPSPQPASASLRNDLQSDMNRAYSAILQRHPEVLSKPLTDGWYAVSIVFGADGRIESSEVAQVPAGGFEAAMRSRMTSNPDLARLTTTTFRKGRTLPDGTLASTDVILSMTTLPQNYDPSRAVSRVHDVVRRRHADLLLPAKGKALNRLTVFLTDKGEIDRENVEQIGFDSLRRAPLEDEKFAERMAERFAKTLAVDVNRIGVVGFTYVTDSAPSAPLTQGTALSSSSPGEQRTLLVQYAWPRKAGEQGPSMPMAMAAQQQPQSFDTSAALALADYHFPDAFNAREAVGGTPTIVLNSSGEVLRVGRVEYRSGEIHETSLQQQLLPGITLERLISPTLKKADGSTAVVTFAWVSTGTRNSALPLR